MKKLNLLLALLLVIPTLASAKNQEPGLIAVHGEGEIKVRPDIAFLQLSIYSRAKETKVAQQKTSEEYTRITHLLKKEFQIEEKDLKTTGYYVNPEYRYEKNRQIFIGQQVNHSLQVKVRNLDRLGDVLDKVLDHQYDEDFRLNVQGVLFDTEKRQEYETQALTTAMDNAHARAYALAKLSDRKLKSVQRISDANVNFQLMPLNHGRAEARLAGGMAPVSAFSGAATVVPSGEITVQTTVNVEYEMD